MRPRPPTPSSLRRLLSAGWAAALLVASCLNPQPDDFPQSSNDSAPNERATTQTPVDVAEIAPAGNAAPAAPSAPPVLNLGEEPATLAPPASGAPGASSAGDPDADAGAPDAGPPDAALVAQ